MRNFSRALDKFRLNSTKIYRLVESVGFSCRVLQVPAQKRAFDRMSFTYIYLVECIEFGTQAIPVIIPDLEIYVT